MHVSALLLVGLWLLPTFGLFISSIRDKDQIATSGWWTALTATEQRQIYRAPGADGQTDRDGKFIISGNVLEGGPGTISVFGISSREPRLFGGRNGELRNGAKLSSRERRL